MEQEIEKFLNTIDSFLKNEEKIYIVGGFLRDLILKRKVKETIDIDFIVKDDIYSLSKKFADKIKGAWFVLDEENKVIRVVKKTQKNYQFDFALLKGKDVYEDLSLRDFTINAFAIEIHAFCKERFDFIDPFKGREDIEKKIIRMIKEDNLKNDSIRLLRAFSLSAQLGFEIEDFTINAIRENVSLLENEAGERISEELFKILSVKDSHKYFYKMHDLKILDSIFDSWNKMRNLEHGPYHHLDVDFHSLYSLEMLEKLYQELSGNQWKKLNNYLNQEISKKRKRREILKLATLLHDIGKPDAHFVDKDGKIKFTGHEKIGKNIIEKICFKLRLSRQESKILKDMVYYHLRPGFLVDCIGESKRAVFRYFRDTSDEALSIILLSIADKEATRGVFTTEEDRMNHKKVLLKLISDYFREKEEIKLPKLITGWDVIEVLGISSGPIIGKILREIEEAQVEKKITTKEDALKYIKVIYEKLTGEIEK